MAEEESLQICINCSVR